MPPDFDNGDDGEEEALDRGYRTSVRSWRDQVTSDIASIKAEMRAVRSDLKDLKEQRDHALQYENQQRGMWRIIVILGSAIGLLVGALKPLSDFLRWVLMGGSSPPGH